MRNFISALLSIWALMVIEAVGATISAKQWSTTIDVAGRQRMLTQRMSKEFLLVAKGVNVEANKKKMQGSINLFDVSLKGLINGDSAKNIVAQPNKMIENGLKVVLGLWNVFMKLLNDNVNTVRKADGSVDKNILTAVAAQNIPCLKKSNAVVGMLVDAAKAAGASVAGLVVDIAGRQRMLIQRMCKESLLIALDVGTAANVANLKATSYLFGNSHSGIILGAGWAGVPTLTKMCTLQQMREVTHNWAQFKPVLDQILSKATAAESQVVASSLISNISSLSDPLFFSMVAAVKLFVSDTGACNPINAVTEQQWVYLLNNVGKQRFLGQRCSELYMQVANNVDKAASTVDLQVFITTTALHLRSLVEGSIASNIQAPPTQKIADQLLAAYAIWVDLKLEFETSINNDRLDKVTVSRISALSRNVLAELNKATDLYVQAAKTAKPNVRGYIIDISGRQRMLFQKMGKEALLINYGVDLNLNWDQMNSTRDLFKKTHWRLLLGDKSVPNRPVDKTTDICILQQMKVAMDRFQILEQASLDVAYGDIGKAPTLIKELPLSFNAMNKAVGFYAKGKGTCGPLAVSSAEWTGLLGELGRLRAMSQEIARVRLLAGSGTGGRRLATSSDFTAAKEAFAATLKVLTYGSGKINVPAPATEERMKLWFTMNGEWATYEQALNGNDDVKVATASVTMLTKLEEMVSVFKADITKADGSVPVARLDGVSRRTMLMHKMSKEAVLVATGKGSSMAELRQTIATFGSWHMALKDGGYGIQKIIHLRKDLLNQWDAVNAEWTSLAPLVLEVASGSALTYAANIQKMQKIIAKMSVQMGDSSSLYAKSDPVIPAAEEGLPWTLIIYISFSVVLVVGIFITLLFISRRYSARAAGDQKQSMGV
eukprot:TRINITY_DN676_c0_g1_i7.p1 TRINITY_DN676_c0_g1~~TRINITY_DN676_c0_g1_i7.p1  ORF type:complete len:887 (+),score=215.88 TRINITY_DN676_c0_g1_i7:93-2753(+)